MATKPTEALREPGTSTYQGPVVGDANYVRSGSRVPPGNILRLGPRVSFENEAEVEVEAEKPAKPAKAPKQDAEVAETE